MATIKKAPKAQLGKLIKKGALSIIDPAKDAAAASKVVKKIKKTETPLDRKIAKEIAPIRKEIDINKYNNAPARPVVLTDAQKANNARILKEIREGKRKNGGKVGKMKNGGSLSGLTASTKRVGPVDPKGAFTKVQKKTLKGARGKASLTKDKQLGATKMAKRGMSIKKK
jgi:hypothetical protein